MSMVATRFEMKERYCKRFIKDMLIFIAREDIPSHDKASSFRKELGLLME